MSFLLLLELLFLLLFWWLFILFRFVILLLIINLLLILLLIWSQILSPVGEINELIFSCDLWYGPLCFFLLLQCVLFLIIKLIPSQTFDD